MSRTCCLLISACAVMAFTADVGFAQGRGGGGARGGGRSGGSARPSAGSISSGGGARPGTPGLGGSRPSASRPNVGQSPNRPNVQSPGRPNLGGHASRPPVNRPSGGLTPSTRPSAPSAGSLRPNLPSTPGNRPGSGGSGIASRPNVRPDTSVPNLGNRPGIGGFPGSGPGAVNRPMPGNRPDGGSRPGISQRPSLPDRPGGTVTRPGAGDRPNVANRPGINTLPGSTARPTPGDVGDFLGISRPLQPGGGGIASTLPARPGPGNRPVTLPGLADRPGIGNRPGAGNRPGDRPGVSGRPGIGDRPGIPDRPGIGNRPGVNDRPNLADRNQWNRNPVINNRPAWVNINAGVNVNIHNRWNNAFVNPGRAGWWNRPSNRVAFWTGWGLGVRRSWGHFHQQARWFNGPWWGRHRFPVGGWHFHFWNHNHPASFWWGVPTWARLNAWFTWSAPPVVWAQPVFYDYGTEGNVTYVNNMVYVGGEQVATADEFAMSAMDLATVPPPQSDEEAAEAEWMPLGTFAVSTNEKDVEPGQVVQLAVNKAGVISGTLYNIETDQAQAVQGQIDKETQRVAFRLGESEEVVAETGLYNLTQEEAPLHVHFGADRTENYLLVRLEYEDDEEDGSERTQE